jgi:hypothetical protein
VAINLLITALNVNEQYSAKSSSLQLIITTLVDYLFASLVLTQNDTYMVLFTQTPIYLVLMIIISSIYLNENKKFIDELPEEYQQ